MMYLHHGYAGAGTSACNVDTRFDELTFLEGLCDTKSEGLRILVTGSARLDTIRQSGDSLAGRFFSHRLLPIIPAEALAAGENRDLAWHLSAGGFPEPWLAPHEVDVRRWRNQYLDGLVHEDILEFGNTHQLKAMNACCVCCASGVALS